MTTLPAPRSLRRPRFARNLWPAIVLGTAIAVSAGGCAISPAPAGHASGSSIAASATPSATGGPQVATPEAAPAEVAAPTSIDTDALAVLATLPVKGRAQMTGYARTAKFGTAWLDVDRNGCDTRNDILARDLTATVKSGPCTVLSGTLVSPYTGATIHFVRGNTTSTQVQIDHVVALADAWRTGAQQLSQAQRIALANDPANLFAVDGASNSQKSDGDTATWLPASNSFRCTYVSHQVSVKAAYGLWVTPAEHDAMARVLRTCSAASAAPPPAVPVAAPVVVASAPAPGCDPNYSGACVPIAADVDCAGGSGNGPAYLSGTANVVGSDIYRLDGDHDGAACD